jgi:hypothetical protein
MDDQLTQLVELQREQNALLKRYLWRLRFSLLGLLLLTTATGIGLGVVIYQTRNPVSPVFPQTAAPVTYGTWTATPAPAPTAVFRPANPSGTLQVITPSEETDLFGD